MSEVKINPEGKVALVSGGNRGIGKAIVVELLERGAKKVYAGARNPETLVVLKEKYGDRLVPLKLDVTDEATIAEAAKVASDVEILINNAGVLKFDSILGKDAAVNLSDQLAVNVHGVINLTNAFVEVLKQKDAAAIAVVSSLAGLANMPVIGTYSVTKAAVHSVTQGYRAELAERNVLVAGVYPGAIDTDMTKDMEMGKDTPENVAKAVVDGLAAGQEDIYPDVMSEQLGVGYGSSPKTIEREFAKFIG
ncbi:MAG: SDR family oxidoreductase [Reichenbachiella sp.]|uniref:SDR family oxidoreductase n=1 Tax=Reichenbachiella sp. TaxID=2184521 RepID=UPI0029672753|nr:SDR family oxidoreductase [Reichenbachiella sp.]MDW3211254.1 SDR family oxidoreductase [Reichenbachiella sp.]